MKPKSFSISSVFKQLMFLLIVCFIPRYYAGAQVSKTSPNKAISYVDASLDGSQKYVLRVDGKPFYMTNIQIRLEKLRYRLGWDAAARDAIVGQAASDGFNTVSIPIHWIEVEPVKNKFDWTILDEYLGLVHKYNLKMEMLWFGHQSGGIAQWLDSKRLRVPAYVLYSPSPESTETTSEFRMRRDQGNYTLDLTDKRLIAREAYVLGKVMEHIFEWDKKNGSKHVIIGVQIGNEVSGNFLNSETFTSGQVISWGNELGKAVKNSSYPVWTRMNCVRGHEIDRIDVNEALRQLSGTSIDFFGVDIYNAGLDNIRAPMPYKGSNYRMIMEIGAEVPDASITQLAALSGNNAFDFYCMVVDGHGLYDAVRGEEKKFKPHSDHVNDVRLVNKLLNSANWDIALNANGYGLFVHNWSGNSLNSTVGVEGITFSPYYPTSQAISIKRSNTEIVLMNTKGGVFTYPDSLGINGASYGYFDENNQWVKQGDIQYTKTWITPPAGVTVLLTRPDTKERTGKRIQAEFVSFWGGSFVESTNIGFAGNGYVNLSVKYGKIECTNVDGNGGGSKTIRIRYANAGLNAQPMRVIINRVPQTIPFPPTGSGEIYKYVTINAELKSGKTNSINVEAADDGNVNVDELEIL
jgi:hypothetical protein